MRPRARSTNKSFSEGLKLDAPPVPLGSVSLFICYVFVLLCAPPALGTIKVLDHISAHRRFAENAETHVEKVRSALGKLSSHRPTSVTTEVKPPTGMENRVKALMLLRGKVDDTEVIDSLGCNGGLRQAPAAAKRATSLIQRLLEDSISEEKVVSGRVLRLSPNRACCVLSKWSTQDNRIIVSALKMKAMTGCRLHSTTPGTVCWKFLKNSTHTRSETELLDDAVVVMYCAPRLVTDRDLKCAVGAACYTDVQPGLSASTSASGTNHNALPAKVLSDLSKDGWTLGLQEWRLLQDFCPLRFLWYYYQDGNPVQPDGLPEGTDFLTDSLLRGVFST